MKQEPVPLFLRIIYDFTKQFWFFVAFCFGFLW